MQVIQNIKSTVYNIYNHKLTSNYIKHSHFQTSSAIFAILSLCLFTLATVFPLSSAEQRTEAATGTASNTSLTLTTTGGASLDLSVNNSNGTFATTDPTATGYTSTSTRAEFSVTTTNYTGYTLTISASEGDTNGALINSADDNTDTNSIASIDSAISSSTFNSITYNGHWGYKPSKLNSEANTNYLPAPTTTATTLNVTNCPNGTNPCSDASDTYTIDLAARLLYTQASGDYSKTFVLTAVGNQIDYNISYDGTGADTGTTPEAEDDNTNLTYIILSSTIPTKEDYTFKGWCTTDTGTDGTSACTGTVYQPGDQYPINQTTQNNAKLYAMWEKNIEEMQGWRGCSSMSIGDTVTLKDSRDGTKYLVGKLKKSSSDTGTTGGWCWMLENLALDIADSTVQGKMTSSTTNATDTQLGYLKNGGGSSPNTYYAVSKAWNSSNTSNYYDRPLINTDYINTVPTPTYGTASNKVGVYYNYCAASAGTYCYSSSSSSGNATADVCPAGWRLPTGGSSGEFQTLCSAIKGSSCSKGDTSANALALRAALSTPLSGYFYGGSANNQGSSGRWWSSTRDDNTLMYYLYVTASSVNPQANRYRDNGYSIRCILKSDAEINAEIIQQTETMQSITNDQLATIMPSNGSTSSLRDARDDQVYTLAKINGNYWMTQNLAYVGDTGSTASSMIMKAATSNISADQDLPIGDLTAGHSYDAARIHDSGRNDYGVYYNYAAASAGTITGTYNSNTQTYDVCPKGWCLPTNVELSNTSYSSAFSPVESGYYAYGSPYDAGSYGYWWSATPDPNYTDRRYYLRYGGSSLVAIDYGRGYGFSVRCIRSS